MSRIRWGIVGTGGIASAFARDAEHAANAEVVAVGSRSDESAAAFAQTYGIERSHGSYDALYADPEVDAVYVATPHTLHTENSAAALRAGKAVLCEKPLTVTPAESRALLDVARETGGYLAEAMWTHFLPAVQTAREWVETGRIGQILHLKADFGYEQPYDPDSRLFSPGLAGGVLLDMGIYPVALAWWFLREHPEAISAVAHRAPTGVEDDFVARFDYASGAVATLSSSFRCTLPNTAYVIGDEATIRIPDFFRARSCELLHGDDQLDAFEDGRDGLGYEFQIEAVSADVRAGRQQSEVVPWEASLAFQDHMARVFDEIGGRTPVSDA